MACETNEEAEGEPIGQEKRMQPTKKSKCNVAKANSLKKCTSV